MDINKTKDALTIVSAKDNEKEILVLKGKSVGLEIPYKNILSINYHPTDPTVVLLFAKLQGKKVDVKGHDLLDSIEKIKPLNDIWQKDGIEAIVVNRVNSERQDISEFLFYNDKKDQYDQMRGEYCDSVPNIKFYGKCERLKHDNKGIVKIFCTLFLVLVYLSLTRITVIASALESSIITDWVSVQNIIFAVCSILTIVFCCAMGFLYEIAETINNILPSYEKKAKTINSKTSFFLTPSDICIYCKRFWVNGCLNFPNKKNYVVYSSHEKYFFKIPLSSIVKIEATTKSSKINIFYEKTTGLKTYTEVFPIYISQNPTQNIEKIMDMFLESPYINSNLLCSKKD